MTSEGGRQRGAWAVLPHCWLWGAGLLQKSDCSNQETLQKEAVKMLFLKPQTPNSGVQCCFQEQTLPNVMCVSSRCTSGCSHTCVYCQRTIPSPGKWVWHLSLGRQNEAPWDNLGWRGLRPSPAESRISPELSMEFSTAPQRIVHPLWKASSAASLPSSFFPFIQSKPSHFQLDPLSLILQAPAEVQTNSVFPTPSL